MLCLFIVDFVSDFVCVDVQKVHNFIASCHEVFAEKAELADLNVAAIGNESSENVVLYVF